MDVMVKMEGFQIIQNVLNVKYTLVEVSIFRNYFSNNGLSSYQDSIVSGFELISKIIVKLDFTVMLAIFHPSLTMAFHFMHVV